MTNSCSELFFTNKDPNDEIMSKFIYDSLVKTHPEEVLKIENHTVGGWNKFWREALQSMVRLIIHNIL